jgi:competence protein ComEA
MLAVLSASSSMHRQQGAAIALEGKVNPNTAPLASLTRLPGIGPARAEAIIALREKAIATGGGYPYGAIDDLRKVRGIGPKTAGNISDSVSFEGGE